MTEGLVVLGIASSLSAYLWWPVVVLGWVAAGAVLARLLLKHAEKFLFVLVGVSVSWLVARPDEVTAVVGTVGEVLERVIWTVLAFGPWLAP